MVCDECSRPLTPDEIEREQMFGSANGVPVCPVCGEPVAEEEFAWPVELGEAGA